MEDKTYYLSIGQLSELFRAQEISPVEIVDVCLARIDQLNRRLNAFITVLADRARQRAEEADAEIRAGHWRGRLHGVPIGIKDFYDTAGIRTTAGFGGFKDRVPTKDAVSVAKLEDAGAIVIGKMNMHQLGMGTTGLDSHFGPVRNPWNEAYVPGGSSSGSAAAVAAGLCYATLDTDAIGSCRLPAACCGVVGFKGTYGLLSTKGILEGERADEAILWLAHPGITARTVGDLAVVVKALSESSAPTDLSEMRDEALRGMRLRVGVVDNFKADEQVTAAFQAAVETVREMGYHLTPAHAPFDLPPFGDMSTIATDRQTIGDRAFKDADVLVLPTTATTVPAVEDAVSNPQALSPRNTMFANYFGLPAVSIPCGVDDHGLPIGLQIVGKAWNERLVLNLAHQYQIRTELRMKHPLP